MKIENIFSDTLLIKQVVELGTKNSKTLGHFPEGAYIEHAHRGFLICAHEKRQLLGYVLFSITQSKNSIRIIQLCIADEARNKGIAKSLLDTVKAKFRSSFKGIALSCRTDYSEASALWEKYGFKAMNKVRSRSKKENYLYKWWYDFGNPDLFSLSQASSPKQKVVLDSNIIIKLRSTEEYDNTGSQFLLEDWLVDIVDYYYVPEIFNEIKRDQDDIRANETRSFLTHFYEAKFDPDYRDDVFKSIDQIIPSNTINDVSDKRQLAESIASEIGYFVTTDKKLLDAGAKINQQYGIEVLRPIDVILTIHENVNRSNYESARLAGVIYDYNTLRSNQIDSLVENLLARDQGEKKHELRAKLTQSATDIQNNQVKVLRDKDAKVLGIWISELRSNDVYIPIIRTTKSKLANTLFKQFVSEAIKLAVDQHKHLIKISEIFIDTTDQETLEAMGFSLQGNIWVKFAARKVINSNQLFEISEMSEVLQEDRIKERLRDLSLTEFGINLERKLWPLKISNINIPVYIVPIKPYWASQLFDHYAANDYMFGAQASLVWNRENIYYRNINPVSEKFPARILWYASSTKDKNAIRTNSIVASSYLDEVITGEAKELFRRFEHYGIYEWKNIFKLAKSRASNHIKVLKFSDTEVYKRPVSFNTVNDILMKHDRKRNTFAAPLEISNQIFIELYRLGFEQIANE